MPGPLTLIGSGETSERLLNLHQALLGRLKNAERGPETPPPEIPRLVFLDTPAGFQLNTAELAASFASYFKKHFALEVNVAEYKHSSADSGPAVSQLEAANYILAGPGSPTYAIKHWRNSPVYARLVERWQAGAQLVFASAVTIALSRFALPVYEIYKAGDDLHWADGLDLLGGLGYDLAILPHFNNQEGRTFDTTCCFIGRARLLALERLLPPATVILGIDENTACTFDFEAQTMSVTGAGNVTLRYNGQERIYPDGAMFEMERLTPARVLTPPPEPAATPSPAARPAAPRPLHVPAKVREWAEARERLRAEKNFAESDRLRDLITAIGYSIKDSPSGIFFSQTQYANSAFVPSRLTQPAACDWSVTLLAHNNQSEVLRAATSALRWSVGHSVEVVIVDNGSDDGAAEAIADFAADAPEGRVRLVFLATTLGEGAGRNAGFRASQGRHLVILGSHMEITGDVFTPLAATLADPTIGATGSNGLVSADLFNFESAPTPEADALEFYLFAFKRDRLSKVSLLDEKFVFYRNIDLDWSFAFKDKGFRLVTTPDLPLAVHEHPYLRMNPAERDKLSKKNYRRCLDKWRERKDLLLSSNVKRQTTS
ncbi:MAG: glycosyltransferase [Chloroflexi bacterium]|nr:glycosyltransferase [Chloroflexota bacterium]